MGKKTITISFDEEKLNALKMYLTQKNMQAEKELEKVLETLYAKTVPSGVREFIEMKYGTAPKPAEKSRKPKAVPSSAVGVSNRTDGDSV